MEMSTEEFGEFEAVLRHAIDAHVHGERAGFPVGFPHAALIPLDEGESRVQSKRVLRGYGLVGRPGPRCRSSSTGLVRSWPRIETHWSMPPILTKSVSSMPRVASMAVPLAIWWQWYARKVDAHTANTTRNARKGRTANFANRQSLLAIGLPLCRVIRRRRSRSSKGVARFRSGRLFCAGVSDFAGFGFSVPLRWRV